MGKRQQEELRRLEEALLETEYGTEVPDLWDTGPDESSAPYAMYNTDPADVDLDAYSEEVHRGKARSGLAAVVTMLAMVLLSAAILMLLKALGVLG